jgi:hypothetical protein
MEDAEVSAQPQKRTVHRKRPNLSEGTRVRLVAPAFGVRLQSDLGTVVGPDEHDGDLGYYVVRLDAPAQYHHGGSARETLREIVELADNMEVVAVPRAAPSASSSITCAQAQASTET